jgi:glycosyltransferase involved in cell wall biosynthesis
MSKKVIVISNNCFSSTFNNGKTLEAIFNKVPKENISQIFFSNFGKPDFSYCDKYYCILDRDVINSIKSRKNSCGGILKNSKVEVSDSTMERSKVGAFLSNRKSLQWIIRDIIWKTGKWKTEKFQGWCIEQKADYIFFVGGPNGFAHEVALYVKNLLKIPLVTFFTDDYLIYPKTRNIFDAIQKYRIERFYSKTIDQSSLCFCISQLMSEEYSLKYERNFRVIMNSVSIGCYLPNHSQKDKFVLNYFGSIHTNRWKMLVRLGNALKNIKDLKVQLQVYCINSPEESILKAFNQAKILYAGGVSGDELTNEISKSDILLHVESDDEYSKSITRLSVSTKIPEYLAAGKPILGFGPSEVASMRLLSENNIGMVIDSKEEESQMIKKLNSLFHNEVFRNQLAKCGHEYVKKNYDNDVVTSNFNADVDSMFKK